VTRSVGLAVVVAIFAPLGDLAESIVKRDLGMKDIGSVLPGHGGVLDRIDAVLFVAPAAFLYLRLILP
jgi:phosphatidate cytidylyltransferase